MDFEFFASRWGKTLLVLAVVGIISAAAISQGLVKYSITPGFGGEQNGIWGYQASGQPAVPIGSTLKPVGGSCSLAWQGGDTYQNAAVINIVSGCGFLPSTDKLVFSTQTNVIPYSDPYSLPIKISYYVPVPNQPNRWMIVNGQVQVYTFTTNVAIDSGSSGSWSFSGDTVWFNLFSLNWNNAAPALTSKNGTILQGQAFETPLYMVSTQCQWTNQSPNNAIGPCQAGGSFGGSVPFYTSPYAGGVCGTLAGLANPSCTNNPPTQALNQSLSSIYAPDTRMSRLAYYPVVITHMQNACLLPGFSCNAPSVAVTFKLYTLLIGEYILTNPDKTQLTGSFQGCTGLACFFNAIGGFFGNPLAWLGLAGLGLIGVAVIVLIFAGPALIAMILLLQRRKEA